MWGGLFFSNLGQNRVSCDNPVSSSEDTVRLGCDGAHVGQFSVFVNTGEGSELFLVKSQGVNLLGSGHQELVGCLHILEGSDFFVLSDVGKHGQIVGHNHHTEGVVNTDEH